MNKIAKACSEASLTLEGTDHPELSLLLQMAANEIERLDGPHGIQESNDILRSAYAVAARNGLDTNWDAFSRRLEGVLVAQSVLLNGTSYLPAATCTPKTFRLPPASRPSAPRDAP